jgi:hypothetical protein
MINACSIDSRESITEKWRKYDPFDAFAGSSHALRNELEQVTCGRGRERPLMRGKHILLSEGDLSGYDTQAVHRGTNLSS